MHQYLETVRNQIENAAGQESYLASSLFLRIYQALKYEDEGICKLGDKEEYEKIQHQALNSLMNKDKRFNLEMEVLSWQVAILRDISHDFYNWWVSYKEDYLMAEDCFQDGESCIRLESSCEKLNLNPTEVFTFLLEVEYLLSRLQTCCNKVMFELHRFWRFKVTNGLKDPRNKFLNKRIESESKGMILSEGIEILEKVAQKCTENARLLAGADHLLWINPAQMLNALSHALKGFLTFEYQEDSELILNQWIDQLFPGRLPDGEPNPLYQGSLHHRVIANLGQAIQCLVQHSIRHNDAFRQRDDIMRPFIRETLENVKRTELINLKTAQDAHEQTTQNRF